MECGPLAGGHLSPRGCAGATGVPVLGEAFSEGFSAPRQHAWLQKLFIFGAEWPSTVCICGCACSNAPSRVRSGAGALATYLGFVFIGGVSATLARRSVSLRKRKQADGLRSPKSEAASDGAEGSTDVGDFDLGDDCDEYLPCKSDGIFQSHIVPCASQALYFNVGLSHEL